MSNENNFYTDSNGRQILTRRVGFYGDSKTIKITDPIAGNYYPINAHISINDEKVDKQLTMIVDRAQGGSSINNGQIEVMIHRRHVHKQIFVDEVLDETAYGVGLAVRGTHLLLLSGISESAKLVRSLSQQMYKQPQISCIPTNLSFQEWFKSYNMEVCS